MEREHWPQMGKDMNSLQCHREPPYLKVICDIDNYVLKNGAVHFFAMEKFQINPILANVLILYPLKRPENQKTFGFLVFSGSIKWEHWPEMG